MKWFELSLRELLLVLSILAVVVYFAERNYPRRANSPLNAFRGSKNFLPFATNEGSSERQYFSASPVRPATSLSIYRAAVNKEIESIGWQVLSEKTYGVETEFVHFDRWIIKKDDTIGSVTMIYANETAWPNKKLFSTVDRFNYVELFAEFWIAR
jgi:hypothetical protein